MTAFWFGALLAAIPLGVYTIVKALRRNDPIVAIGPRTAEYGRVTVTGRVATIETPVTSGVRIRHAVEAEILWHFAEARKLRAAADELDDDDDEEATLDLYCADVHEDAAAHLQLILEHPRPAEPEVQF